MVTTVKPVYGSSVALTLTHLNGMGSGAKWTSAIIDNTSNLYDDIILSFIVKIGASNPLTTYLISCFVWEILDDTPTYPDVITGSEGNFTPTSTNVFFSGPTFKNCGSFIVDTANTSYYNTVRLSTVFAGSPIPKKWGVAIVNNSNVALASSGNAVSYTPVQFQGV